MRLWGAERLHLNQGMSLAEHVLPLARNFTALELGTGELEGAPPGSGLNSAIPGVNGGKTLSPRIVSATPLSGPNSDT